VQAEAISGFWPQLGMFVTLDSDTRLFLNLPYTSNLARGDSTLDIAACLDRSPLPVLRLSLQTLDWQRGHF
jgi:hypothetical protein